MSDERFALDTNVLVYAIDGRFEAKQARARSVLGQAAVSRRCVLALQSVGEFYAATQRRDLLLVADRVEMGRELLRMFPIVSAEPADAETALDAVGVRRLSYWDALLLATVARAGCSVLLSEDMQDGSTVGGVTVRNPFVGDSLPEPIARLLAA